MIIRPYGVRSTLPARRDIHGVWLIERETGRYLVARAYANVSIDMDLIAPFLSATHTFIDKASSEELQTIDTEGNRYVWVANDDLLFVMVISKSTRLSHMRFLLKYALDEFQRRMKEEGKDVASVLKNWHGAPGEFDDFSHFIDELVSQYEQSDERLVTGKAMDCLSVYSHLYHSILKAEEDKEKRKDLLTRVVREIEPMRKHNYVLDEIEIDGSGIDVFCLDVNNIGYRTLRKALEDILQVVATTTRETVGEERFKQMIFEHAMPYVKRDLDRLETYAIVDDVIRYLF